MLFGHVPTTNWPLSRKHLNAGLTAKRGLNVSMGKIRHIAISVSDAEKAAAFYEAAFGLERVSEATNSIQLSDGTINLTLLNAPTNPGATDKNGDSFLGLHHFGFRVGDLIGTGQKIASLGGSFDCKEEDETITEGAEFKYRDPNGIMFDLTTLGWAGARADF